MIITLIMIGIIVGAIVCWIIYTKCWNASDGVFGLAMLLTLLAVFGGSSVSVGIIDNQVNKDIYYQNILYEREMLEYRIDNIEEDIVGNEMLYNDIVEFNNELRSTKKWATNPWTSWFYNEDIATIDYVEIDGR